MKIRVKIIGSLVIMIAAVLCVLIAVMVVSSKRLRTHGDEMMAHLSRQIEENVRDELIALAGDISRYVTAVEMETDKNMLNAAKLLAEVDFFQGGRLTLADLNRLKQVTGMTDLYLGNMTGVFTLSTELNAVGLNLFDIWDGYRMLVTGESDYLPSTMKIKVETGEIFKFTAIPRYGGRGVLESALNAESIERYLQDYITNYPAIRSLNFFDYTFLTLTENVAQGRQASFAKGGIVNSGGKGYAEISALFGDSSKISLSLDKTSASLYYPVIVDNAVRYVMYLDIDPSSYFQTRHMLEEPLSELLGESTLLNALSSIAVAVLLVLFTVIISLMTSQLLKPLGFFTGLLTSFSTGDFSIAVPQKLLDKKDEMGEMAESFRNTSEKMRALIRVIREQANSLSQIGEELAGNMTRTAVAVDEITGHIQSIKSRAINQSASVTETNATMERITVNIDQLNTHVETQTSGVAKSSSAIEEMIANINSVTGTLMKNAESVKELLTASDIGRTGLQEVSGDIQEIARESEGLLEINGVMQNIASQTNLLSMNAAIEAAHAGESGKGFAVVADEIRKLAESSSAQSKTISAVLKKIKTSIDKITSSTHAVLNKFEAIDGGVKTVSQQAENIRNAMEEQSVGSRQILEVISQLNEITRLVKSGSEEMLDGSKEIISEGKNLEVATDEISQGMNEMATGADQINVAVSRVNEISGQNKDRIELLVREVSRFRVE